MWVYPDKITPEDHKARVGDIVVVTVDEYGSIERRVGLVIEAAAHDDCVNLIKLRSVDPDNFEFYDD